MPKVRTEFFMARRLSGRDSSDRRNVMVKIATVTVAISMAVMIVALAVILGFKRTISDKLAGFGGHVQVVNMDGNTSMETTPILRNGLLVERIRSVKDFASIDAYAVKGGIVKTEEATQGIMLRGVENGYDWSFFTENLVEGELPSVGDSVRTKDVLVSQALSSLLKIGVDDRVEMVFMSEGTSPRRDRFKVTGIYDTGMEELDKTMIITDIRNVQRLNNWDYDRITGYDINTVDFNRLDVFADAVYDIVLETETPDGEYLMVTDIKERYPNLFDWLKAHDVNAAVIITIMLLVALLNMIAALLIIVLERTRMIGVLKSLGMNNLSLQKMFVIRSGYIIAKGMLWGNAAGIGLCLVQKYTHLVKLDQAGYFLSEVPIQLGVGWILTLNLGAFVLLLLLLAVPTSIVSQIKPEKTIRYQ